jgi:quinol monooxygenase YgiN
MMSVMYIGQSQAKLDKVDDFRYFLISVVAPAVKASEGCESYQLFQSRDNPAQFIGIEVWTSVEAHRASVKNIPAESISKFMEMIDGTPNGGYYDLVE